MTVVHQFKFRSDEEHFMIWSENLLIKHKTWERRPVDAAHAAGWRGGVGDRLGRRNIPME